MQIFSRHNIFSKIQDSENYFLVNILNGNADILNPQEASFIQKLMSGAEVPDDFMELLLEKEYITNPEEEARRYRNKYLEFLDSRDDEEIQLFFVPNYHCNFACTYCFQDEYTYPRQRLSKEIIDAFFSYIKLEFAGRRVYITVFGGEPLLNSLEQRSILTYFLEESRKLNLDVCVVTNGYFLTEYLDILALAKIREIQLTLDGVGETHDKRRFLKGGGSTFEKIVTGIDQALLAGFPVNLRMVMDKENINALPELARFAIEKGWTKHHNFKVQIGRNYELHHCQSNSEKLFNRVSLYESIYELTKTHPYILDFYKPAYSITKFLAETNSLPDALFDACPACKTEWAFDYTGAIYSCTATVGKSVESLGSFYPEITKDTEVIAEWERRDVTEIEKCKSCNLSLACGGGCGSVAKNASGSICSPDCRPITELLSLGFASYFVKQMSIENINEGNC
jgi:uncharacterized protein